MATCTKINKKSESLLGLLFPLQRQCCSLDITEDGDSNAQKNMLITMTKAERKRPLGLENDVESTLAILINNCINSSPKLMASLVFQMALTRTSSIDADSNQSRPLGKVTILTTSAWTSKPKAVHGMPKATFQALTLLNFVYIKDLNDLHKYLLVMPNSLYAPDLLILDESLEKFLDTYLKVNNNTSLPNIREPSRVQN